MLTVRMDDSIHRGPAGKADTWRSHDHDEGSSHLDVPDETRCLFWLKKVDAATNVEVAADIHVTSGSQRRGQAVSAEYFDDMYSIMGVLTWTIQRVDRADRRSRTLPLIRDALQKLSNLWCRGMLVVLEHGLVERVVERIQAVDRQHI